ncbi:MAG: alpha/beta fold hydrolase [Candidatus Dormibacteraceae bacterium]
MEMGKVTSNGEPIRRVRAGDIDLAYRLWPGTGPAIVAIHGLTASHVNFIGIAERLAGRRPVLAFDLRGRGQSDKPATGYGMRQHALDVAAAMRSLGLGRSVVLGHSMGAYIGTALAVEAPELVAGLVMLDGGYLLDLPANFDPDLLLDTLLKPQVERLRTTYHSRAAYIEFWRGLPAFPAADWGPWVEAYLEYDLGGEPPALRARVAELAVREDFRSMAQKQEVKQRLLAISCPVMVVRAQDGVASGQPPIIPDQVMAEIRECIPSVEEHRIPGTTHYTIALADPGASAVADLVDKFAARCLDSTVISN